MRNKERGRNSKAFAEMTSYIANRIKNARIEKGMTQTMLAKKANISVSFLCDLEHGNVLPSLILYSIICHQLDIVAIIPVVDDND